LAPKEEPDREQATEGEEAEVWAAVWVAEEAWDVEWEEVEAEETAAVAASELFPPFLRLLHVFNI
jgi:hypothetical protein